MLASPGCAGLHCCWPIAGLKLLICVPHRHPGRISDIACRDFRKDFHAFRKMGSQKPKLVHRFLTERRWAAVVLSDTDTVWLRDPEPYLALHPSADVFISTDCLSHQVRARPDTCMASFKQDELEAYRQHSSYS